MSTSVSAVGRILFPYNWGGGPHKLYLYVRNPQVSGGTYNVNSRPSDANDTDWTTVADRAWATVRNLLTASAACGTCELQTRSGLLWTTVAVHAPASAAGAAGTRFPASQVTLTLRDVLFKKVKVIVLDTNQTPPNKYVTATGGDAQMDAFIANWVSGASNPADPYNCIVSRGNQFLNVSPFVSISVDINRDARRSAGLGG